MSAIEAAFSGRVGRDPELRHVKGGELALLSLTVAVGGAGDGGDEPEWVKVAVFGERAEELAGRIQRGGRVYVEGKLKLERWEGRDGAPRAGLAVTATLVQVLGQIGKRRPAAGPPARAEAAAGSSRPAPPRPPAGRQLAPAGDDDGFWSAATRCRSSPPVPSRLLHTT